MNRSRRVRVGSMVLGWALLAASAAPALAQEEPYEPEEPRYTIPEGDTWDQRKTALDVHLGIATPQGELGLSLTHLAGRRFAVSGSAGVGLTGPHLSLMPRAQLPWDGGAVGIGVGLTGVPGYVSAQPCFLDCKDFVRAADLMLWGNAEAFLILQEDSGFRLGFYGGYTQAFHAVREHLIHTETREERTLAGQDGEHWPGYIYGGIHFGYAF